MDGVTTDELFYSDIASEFLQHYRVGPRLIAVTGVEQSDPARAADALAAQLRERGQEARRATRDAETDADAFRTTVVAPFRAGDGVLVVDGPGLLDPGFRGFWNFSVWHRVNRRRRVPHPAPCATRDRRAPALGRSRTGRIPSPSRVGESCAACRRSETRPGRHTDVPSRRTTGPCSRQGR